MMTDEDLRQMYVNMAERDCDGSLDAIKDAAKQYMAQEAADAKKNDFLNSIPLTKTGTNADDSQTKESPTTT